MTYDEWAEENLNFTVSLAFPDQGKILLDKYRKCWQDAQAALRSPAPAATVTGWRLLEVGEVVQAGDEFIDDDGLWKPSVTPGLKVNLSTYRRRLPPPALTETMRDAIKLLEFINDYSIDESIRDDTRATRMVPVTDIVKAQQAHDLLAALAAKELR